MRCILALGLLDDGGGHTVAIDHKLSCHTTTTCVRRQGHRACGQPRLVAVQAMTRQWLQAWHGGRHLQTLRIPKKT